MHTRAYGGTYKAGGVRIEWDKQQDRSKNGTAPGVP